MPRTWSLSAETDDPHLDSHWISCDAHLAPLPSRVPRVDATADRRRVTWARKRLPDQERSDHTHAAHSFLHGPPFRYHITPPYLAQSHECALFAVPHSAPQASPLTPSSLIMSENGTQQQQRPPRYPSSPLDNGTNIGSAAARKECVASGMERRPSGTGSDRRSSNSSSRRPSFGAPLHPMTSMTAVDAPDSAVMSGRSSRASSRRGSGTYVSSSGQPVVIHTRTQVSFRFLAELTRRMKWSSPTLPSRRSRIT